MVSAALFLIPAAVGCLCCSFFYGIGFMQGQGSGRRDVLKITKCYYENDVFVSRETMEIKED